MGGPGAHMTVLTKQTNQCCHILDNLLLTEIKCFIDRKRTYSSFNQTWSFLRVCFMDSIIILTTDCEARGEHVRSWLSSPLQGLPFVSVKLRVSGCPSRGEQFPYCYILMWDPRARPRHDSYHMVLKCVA